MRTLLVIGTVASLLGWCLAESLAQEDKLPASLLSHEFSGPDQDRPWDWEAGTDLTLGSRDLWYGTPGVCAGADLLGPILQMVKKPSGLLDFRPRRISTFFSDRDTAEFLRERR